MTEMIRILCLITGLLLVTSFAYAGGVDPRDLPAQKPVIKEKVTATPAQTSAAVSKARRVVAPEVTEERISAPQPKAVTKPKAVATPKPIVKSTSKTSWMISKANGTCSPLSSINNKVNVGTFKTPQDLAHKIRQRGNQVFALDIGETPDQVVRVKSPDKKLDVTFVRAAMCR